MKDLMKPISTGLCVGAVALACVLPATVSNAQIITLTDGGSTAVVDLNSSAGMKYWAPEGLGNQLNQQWFWYRIGDQLAAPINSLGLASYSWDSAAPGYLSATYGGAGAISVTINYLLTGASIGHADIVETINIHNNTGGALSGVHFYQYSDFNLLGTGGDTVQVDAASAYQFKGASEIAEGIILPNAAYFEGNLAGPGGTLDKLATVSGLNLSGATGAGPGDVTWAFQWDFSIDPNSDAGIFKDKQLSISIVPEPSVLALMVLGLGAFSLRRRAQA